jgi:hypothetical protein
MFVYELGNRIYCANCYMKLVKKEDQQPIHEMEGGEFYHRFQNNPVECAKCGICIQHDHVHKTSYKSLGGPGKKED